MSNQFNEALRDFGGELAPRAFVIGQDDFHASLIGTTKDGLQFFITTPYIWIGESAGSEFAARYLFDNDGHLVDTTIMSLGHRPGDGSLPGNATAFDAQQVAVERLLAEITRDSSNNVPGHHN